MFLSIIIPVYNIEKFLDDCLISCLNQNIDNTTYEIICINDGSKDNSLKILNTYAQKHQNIVVIDQPNAGVSVARNKGIEIAKGDYLWFVDSDDFIEINCLKKLKEFATNDYDVISFGAYAFGESFSKEIYESLVANSTQNNPDFFHDANYTQLYKSNLIHEHKIRYQKGIAYGEDTLFCHEFYTVAKNKKKLEGTLYFYRKNPESAMNSLEQRKGRLKYMDSTIATVEYLKNGLENGRFTIKSSGGFLQSKYKQISMMVARINVKDAMFYLKTMSDKGLFNKDFIKKYNLPQKSKIIAKYATKHFKIWLRGFMRKLLPEKVVAVLKNV